MLFSAEKPIQINRFQGFCKDKLMHVAKRCSQIMEYGINSGSRILGNNVDVPPH